MSDRATFAERELAYFNPILPLVRTDVRQGLFGSYHQVTAVYEDAIVRGGCRYLESVHAGALDAKSLASRLRGTTSVLLDDQSKVAFSPGGRRTRRARFTVAGKSKLTFYVPMPETEHVLSFLRARLGDRLTLGKSVPIHHAGLMFLIVLLLAVALASFTSWEGGTGAGIELSALAAALAAIVIHDHIPAPAPWAAAPKKKRSAADLSQRRPFRSMVLGWTLKIVCAALLFILLYFDETAAQFLYRHVVAHFTQSEFAATRSVSALLWLLQIAALVGLYAGHLMAQRNPTYVQAQDQRPPILYLRSFLDDRKQTLVAPSPWAIMSGVRPPEYLPFPWRYILMANPIRILRVLFGASADTSEEQLGLFLRRLGPFVAIGQPGERFASPGAARMYVSNEEWQDVVDSYLAQSKFVVLQPASTEGVWWEVERVLQRVAPEKILFCLVNFFQRPNDYEAFQLRADKLLQQPLPHAAGLTSTPAFLFFRADGTPCLVATSYRRPLAWPLLGNPVDLATTLLSFLAAEQAGSAAAPVVPQRPHGISFASHCGASLTYLVLLVVLPLAWAAINPWRDLTPVANAVQQNPLPVHENQNAVSPTPVAKLLAEADQLFSAGKVAEAKAAVEAALVLEPNNGDAHGYRGIFLKAEGKLAEAAAEVQQATVFKPNDPSFWSVLGQIQIELNQFAEAEVSMNKALELKPDQATFYFNRGFVRSKLNRFDAAAADFVKAIELKQLEEAVLARACEMCGLSLQKAGKVVEAMPYFNSAVQLQPDNVEAQMNRALAFQALGAQKFTDGSAAEFARKGFEEVLRLAPSSTPARFGRALALQILGENTAAIEDFDIVLQREPKNDLVLWKRGLSHLTLGHYEQAAADYRLAAELDPADRSAVELLMRIHVAQGRFDEALSDCRKLLATPQRADYLQAHAVLLFLSGSSEEAAATARRESVPSALKNQLTTLQIVAGSLTLLPPADPELATEALATMQTLADAPSKNLLASLIAVALHLKIGQIEAAQTRLDAIDPKQAQGPVLAFRQLCQAEFAAAGNDPAAARKSLQECSAWFEEFCPLQFAEGRPETFSADWSSRSVFGLLYRDAAKRIGGTGNGKDDNSKDDSEPGL